MKRNSIAAVVAAEFVASYRFRPRLVQLTPRTFHLLSRSRNISSTSKRSILCTAIRRAQPPASDPSKASRIDEDGNQVEPVLSTSVTDTQGGESILGDPEAEAQTETLSAEERQTFFVNLMRTVPHPVVVITARKQDVEEDIQGTFAATVSSFNSVSIDPDLIVSFNLKAGSMTYQTIVESKYFTVTFPQMNSAGADLVESFIKGNNPPPLSVNDPNRPNPQPFHWIDRQSNALSDLKHHPPTVALADPSDISKSGFAFAFTCEYQTSTAIGDHVIVSGRLSSAPIKTAGPAWGVNKGGTPFSQNPVTLTHAHGTYSSAHTGFGFTDTLRLDEALDTRHLNRHRKTEPQRKINLCRRRLKLLALAQLSQQGIDTTKPVVEGQGSQGHTPFVHKFTSMAPQLLQEYERYYMQRLAYWELKLQKLTRPEPTSPPEEPISNAGELALHPYANLAGHERLFIRNKMLLGRDDLDEEIALYKMRLSKLKAQMQEDPVEVVTRIDDDDDSVDERAPEETGVDPNAAGEEDGLSRDKQLIQYFRKRVHLLELAKMRKDESSTMTESLEPIKNLHEEARALKRFLGVQKNESLQGLKTKYRRYQYQLTEARLALLGLEEIQGGHQNIQILRNRVKFFEPRLAIVEECIKDRAKKSTAQDLLAENFHLPPMRIPDDEGTLVKVKPEAKGSQPARPLIRKYLEKGLVKTQKYERTPEAALRTGDSVDQLDISAEEQSPRSYMKQNTEDTDRTRQAVSQAAKKLPVGIHPRLRTAYNPFADGATIAPDVEEEEELRGREEQQQEAFRRNAREVRDFLVLQGSEGGDETMPSPDDFIDVKKMRRERTRMEEDEERHRQEEGHGR